jgi:hypothetical protein
MPQVFLPFATDAKGQTLYEHVQANTRFLLGTARYDTALVREVLLKIRATTHHASIQKLQEMFARSDNLG